MKFNIISKDSYLAVSELVSDEYESLLIMLNFIFALNFILYIINGVWLPNDKNNDLSYQDVDEDLHTSSKSEDHMKSWLLLNAVISESSFILQLDWSEVLNIALALDKNIIYSVEESRGVITFNLK